MNVNGVTVLICTYNRAAFLRETLAALNTLVPPESCAVEVLVVDNSSTDDTRHVVADARTASRFPVRYLFEPLQGKSFALNRGLADAAGEVLALTDDDVLPSRTWLARIVAAFREHDISFAFGKVLPRWDCLPPPELLTERAHDIWGPLAIVDYGNEPALYDGDSTGQKLPVGANLSFSRDAIQTIGGWRTDLGKVNNTLISGEDHEIFFRLRRAGLYAGYYDPSNLVWHHVPASRLTRKYFRRWFYWHGRTLARMTEEFYAPLDLASVPHIAGVPRFLYRQALHQFWVWARTLATRNALDVLVEELQCIEYVGFFRERWRPMTAPDAAEVSVRGRANGAGQARTNLQPRGSHGDRVEYDPSRG